MKKKIFILSIFILIVGIIYLLPNTMKKTYAVGTTLADTVIALNKGSSWSAGASGVYYTNNHEYRYIGAEPNNYVSFNNDLYRIIGVFDSNSHGKTGKNLVKLIRARTLGGYSWGAYNSSATSGEYSNFKTDWTGNTTGVKANANVLLNEYFYGKTNTSNTYGACNTWTYYYNNTNYRTNDCSDIVEYGINNTLQSYIEEVTWYLKGYEGRGYSKQNFYLCERGQSTDTTNCMSGNSGAYDASTTARIGLMYVSDYMYASSYFADTSAITSSSQYYGNKNWLYKGSEWTITPDANSASTAFYVYPDGSVSMTSTCISNAVRPSFYLKSNVYVTGGNGSFDNPYTIACDDCGSSGTTPEPITPQTTLTKLALTANTTTPNFGTAATTNEGVFAAEDDLGTSYYFRGAVENNYVKFAGFYWRIIRINGDGSIRMIYDGTSPHANGEESEDKQIGTSIYDGSLSDNAFVGYMNGTTDGINFPNGTTNSTSYEEAHTNRTNSDIKTYIDNWYKTNIVDTGYSGSVVDAIYCNDRAIVTDETIVSYLNGLGVYMMMGSDRNRGYGKSATFYNFFNMASFEPYLVTPSLVCAQNNDKFTQNENIGNGALTYPVGLVTADELIYSGMLIDLMGGAEQNYNLFLSNGSLEYHTMTPGAKEKMQTGGGAIVIFSVYDGNLNALGAGNYESGVRPVISISPSAIQYGTGISTDPFRTTSAI